MMKNTLIIIQKEILLELRCNKTNRCQFRRDSMIQVSVVINGYLMGWVSIHIEEWLDGNAQEQEAA